jgi:hypothetical protein
MRYHRPLFPWISRCSVATALLIAILAGLPLHAFAGLILDAEVRITAEDNIVGLLSGNGDAAGTGGGAMMSGAELQAASAAGSGPGGGKGFGGGPGAGRGSGGSYTGGGAQSPGDISVTGRFELGGFTDAGDGMELFAKGYAERTEYQEFTEYDVSVAGVSAGLTAALGDRLSVRLAGFDRISRYDNDPDRDSTAYGGNVAAKQRIVPGLWLRQTAEYETSRAAYQDFSYRGATYRIGAGHDLTGRLLVTAGYGLRSRQYQDASRTVLRTGIASLGADHELSRRWSAGLAYDREATSAGASDVITRNNVLSFSLRYSY